jgi:hypothetical protein
MTAEKNTETHQPILPPIINAEAAEKLLPNRYDQSLNMANTTDVTVNSMIVSGSSVKNVEPVLSKVIPRIPESKWQGPSAYSLAVLLIVTLARTSYTMQKNSIGYVYGYEGLGFRADNPIYMISVAFPQMASVYGIVASVTFSVAYAVSNIFMASASKRWNKKLMLCLAMIGMSCMSLTSGMTESLLMFSICRFTFGIFASAINAPIYQLIASNFNQK